MALEERHGGNQRRDGVVLVHLGCSSRAASSLAGVPPTSDKQIDRIGEIALDREPARDILEVRIEPAVLVDDEDDRALALGLGAREIAVDLPFGES